MSNSPEPEDGPLPRGAKTPASGHVARGDAEAVRASGADAPIGAAPIRWSWWAIGIAVSLGLWALLARAVGWI